MLFNSIHYLIFFPLVAVLFFLLPIRFRAIFLVLASCYFYMVFKAVYILILLVVIAIDYFSGLYIEKSVGRRRKLGLIVSICSNVGILFIFKYYNFAAENLAAAARVLGLQSAGPLPPHLQLVLPIGLSFHTFQSLAYIIEVFYGRYPAERNPIRFALYVLFFPQMVAGPIETPQGLLRQLHLEYVFSYGNAVQGLRLMLVGFWNKLLVADNLAPYVDAVYQNPAAASGLTAVLATVCFAVQIYCDFCGYSQIAIGSAKVLGINLITNFDHPYRARSFADFWRRWHISLSSWFRDYVYIPLGGNRVGPLRRDGNIVVVFLLSGLWHGANWTYVIWGGLHGMYVLVEHHLSDHVTLWQRTTVVAYRMMVFILVCLAWTFFRARSIADALIVVRAVGLGWSTLAADLQGTLERVWQHDSLQNSVAIGLIAYLVLGVIEPFVTGRLPAGSRLVRWTLYYAMIVSIVLFAKFESRSFIYFQF